MVGYISRARISHWFEIDFLTWTVPAADRQGRTRISSSFLLIVFFFHSENVDAQRRAVRQAFPTEVIPSAQSQS